MTKRLTAEQLAAQAVKLDFGGEVLYAFECCPENARRNAEILRRAYLRANNGELREQK